MYISARVCLDNPSFGCQTQCKKWDVFIFVVLVIGVILVLIKWMMIMM